MAKAKGPKRPKARGVGPVRLRVVRGPDADGRWYWRAGICEGGGERTIWTGWATAADAEREVAGKVSAGDLESSKGRASGAETVLDLMELYLGRQAARADIAPATLEANKIAAKRIVKQIGDVVLSRLDRRVLEGYRDRGLRGGVAPKTIRHDVNTIRAAWRWAKELALVELRDLPAIRLSDTPSPARTHYTPTPGEMRDLVRGMEGWAEMAMWLLIGTGCRIGEIDSLLWSQIDLERQVITVTGKTGPRTIPLSPPILRRLREWRGQQPGERVWPVSKPGLRGGLRKRMRSVAAEVGITHLSPHGIRRAVVDALYRSGVDPAAAATVAGHSPLVALRHYRKATEGDARQAVRLSRLGYLPEGRVIEMPQPSQMAVTDEEYTASNVIMSQGSTN